MMKIKKLITFCLSAMLAASSCSHAFAAGRPGTWASNDKGWWIAYEDGSYLTNDWYQSPTSGLWYYMGADGYMLTNTTTPDGYWVNADGVWIEGSAGNTGSSTDSATQSAWKNEFRTKWTAAYNDAAGKWAEEFGFAGMLVGGSARVLDWRSPNHVYEAAGCEYLRLLVRNSHLSELIERGDDSLLVEKKTEEGEARKVLSVGKFRKMLDLDFLRGGLVNLYFDAQVLAQQRERGVIGFFDELIATWLDGENQKFATAAEACMVETPTAELSIKETVSWRGDAEKSDDEQGAGLVLKGEIENKLPKWLGREDQVKLSELVYGVRRQILASEDEKLSADWRRLTLADYHKGVDSSVMARVTAIVDDLKRRAEEIKKTQAVEISRAYTKKRDRGDVERKVESAVDDSAVKVNFGKSAGTVSGAVHVRIQADEGLEVPVQRLGQREEVEAEEEAEVVPVVQKKKTHAVRKIIKKLVIE